MTEARYEYRKTRSFRALGRVQWRWRFRARTGEIIASGEGYYNLADCMRAIEIMRQSADAPVREVLI